MKNGNGFVNARRIFLLSILLNLIIVYVLNTDIVMKLPSMIYLGMFLLGYFVMPSIDIICWGICQKNYLRDKFVALDEKDSLANKLLILGYIAFQFVCLVMLWININDLLEFVFRYKDYIEKLYDCVVINALLIMGWSFCIFMSIWILNICGRNGRIFYKRILLCIIIFIMLLNLFSSTSKYCNNKADDMWYEWIKEEYEEYEKQWNGTRD